MKDIFIIIYKLIRYNIKIIFVNKFVYFFAANIIVFFITLFIKLYTNEFIIHANDIYNLLLLPGILSIFYYSTYGIQDDIDNYSIEIVFTVPDYINKIYLVRLFINFLVICFILTVLSVICSYIIIHFPIKKMIFQLSFPIVFLGSLSFYIFTILHNGDGTAVINTLLGLLIWMTSGFIKTSKWNIILNPFYVPINMNSVQWSEIIFNNRLYLSIGTILLILFSMLNLQKRENFI